MGGKTKEKSRGEGKANRTLAVAGVAGAGATGGFLLLKDVDFKAWDALLRSALNALLVRDGPLPVILFAFVLIVAYACFFFVMKLIDSKDQEIQRLTRSRDNLEKLLGVPHPPSGLGPGDKKR